MNSFYIVLLFYNNYFTTCLRKLLKDLLINHLKQDNEENKFLSQFCLWFRSAWLIAQNYRTLFPRFHNPTQYLQACLSEQMSLVHSKLTERLQCRLVYWVDHQDINSKNPIAISIIISPFFIHYIKSYKTR